MKFLMLIRSSESNREQPMSPEFMAALDAYMARSFENGTLVDTGGLGPTKDGGRVRLSKGALSVVDGPFTEAKEVIGGWAIVEAASYADAMRVAREFMGLHVEHLPWFEGECEVRTIEFKAR